MSAATPTAAASPGTAASTPAAAPAIMKQTVTALGGQPSLANTRVALVDPDVQPHPAAPLQAEQRHGQRRAPRSGREHRLAQAAPGQLIAERDAERGRRV